MKNLNPNGFILRDSEHSFMQLEWFLQFKCYFFLKEVISQATVCHLSQCYDYKQSKPYDDTDFC